MKLSVLLHLWTLLIVYGLAESPPDEEGVPGAPQTSGLVSVTQVSTSGLPTESPTALVPPSPAATRGYDLRDSRLSSRECLEQKFTYHSCQKVFCPPWMRCLNGKCECKLPYMCPREGFIPVCGVDGRRYLSFCQIKALECIRKTSLFSHFGSNCTGGFFKTHVKSNKNVVEVQMLKKSFLICGHNWRIPAANVLCRYMGKEIRGQPTAKKVLFKMMKNSMEWPTRCVSVHCTGQESSLAECSFHNEEEIGENHMVAVANCDTKVCNKDQFTCVNENCIQMDKTCDGIDHCGDNSDEMCCKACRYGFHCPKSDVCISSQSLKNEIIDCLGGEDEFLQQDPANKTYAEQNVIQSTKNETKKARDAIEKLVCGIPNKELAEPIPKPRKKRVIGGEEAGKAQIQWQVAIQEGESMDCGGTYIGGCWVLTAAHCVRPKPEAFKIKLSVWSKLKIDDTTDLVPIKNIIIHSQYNPSTYQNDIALIELKPLQFSKKCFHDNIAVAAACVPWSVYQFKPGDTCRISGWGRNNEGMKSHILRLADVEIIGNCSGLYGDRYFDGMECAGRLDGSVDSCQGDSGGPLICTDITGVSYVWGIISWGEKCGLVGHPGVYTKVAHYFDWITLHTGRESVMRYNL